VIGWRWLQGAAQWKPEIDADECGMVASSKATHFLQLVLKQIREEDEAENRHAARRASEKEFGTCEERCVTGLAV
jgi:hypothetical protein